MKRLFTLKKNSRSMFRLLSNRFEYLSFTRLSWKALMMLAVLFAISLGAKAQISLLQDYQNNESAPIGIFQGINFREAGFSGLYAIPNTNGKEFWTISDRGVNVDAANANSAACRPTYDKIYGFPNYAPKIHRIRLNADNSIEILQTITMKRPDGSNATGIINPTGFGSTATEMASTDTVLNCLNFSSKIAPKDVWGIDSEGVVVDNEGYFWICEEGGPTIWKLNQNGVVVKRFTPYANLAGAQSIDVQIDSVFKYRKNNRGFEGISMTPNGKIYAIIQSPVLFPSKSVGEGTRVHRILEIDPTTNATRMFAYLNDGIIGTGSNQIRLRDWKIGDMAAINDHTFLVLEAALRGTTDIKKMYLIDINGATPVTSGLYGGVTLEALVDASGLSAQGITPVQKTLFMDLLANGWNAALDKAEGLAILNDSTIAIGNDNDYGQFSPAENGIATATTNKSHVFVYGLQGANKLAGLCQFTASSISGPSNACAYSGNMGELATYSIETTYDGGFVWTVPPKASIVSGQGTKSITVKYHQSFSSGILSVKVLNGCGGTAIVRTLDILKTIPNAPSLIEGPESVCSLVGSGTSVIYSITPVKDAVSYEWKVPDHVKLISGQGTASIKVIFKSGYTNAFIKVKAVSGCGSSAFQTLKVNASVPHKPGVIAGEVNGVCSPANTFTYSIDPVLFATSYIWSTNIPGSVVSAEGTTATITFPAFIVGTISVTAKNDCGISAPRNVVVTSRPGIPSAIEGPNHTCIGSVQRFSISPIEGATSYKWSVPHGSVIQSGIGTASITVLMGCDDGLVRVSASNNCGAGIAKTLSVDVDHCCDINVYPNPTNGVVNISFKAKENETYFISVHEIISGKVVFSTSSSKAGDTALSTDLSSLPKGVYFVRVKSQSVNTYQRIKIE